MIITKETYKIFIAPLNRLSIATFTDAAQQGLITAKECTELSTALGSQVPTAATFRAHLKKHDSKTKQMFERLSPSRKIWVMGN